MPAATDPNANFPLEDDDIFKVSQSELVAIADTAPSLHTLCGARVARISRNLVIKKSTLTLSSEAEAMKLVAQKTSILLPRVYRSFTIYGTGGIYDSTGYIVMSYIDGVCLSQCREKLLPDERENIIGQVAELPRTQARSVGCSASLSNRQNPNQRKTGTHTHIQYRSWTGRRRRNNHHTRQQT